MDGRSEVTNNQTSWVGEGFEFWPGYIERRYVPCIDDMTGSPNNDVATGDQCWRSDNATMALNGGGSELVYETGKGWHSRSEDASKIEKLTGAPNGDNDGEYWKITAPDGTQYFFGLNNLPGQTSTTDSAWTVPLAGNHTGEPCHASTFAASFCSQAWRWNLDYVVDVHGNTMSYWYGKETNKYARNLTASDAAPYIRGGWLDHIDYGTWDRGSADRSISPIAQALFTPADRCVTSSCGTHDGVNWPDVPWDQECVGTSCPGQFSPTFWSTKRLSKVTTRVWDTTKPTPDWQNVDSWILTHSFPPAGDGSTHAGLWLNSIQNTGLVGAAITLPPVTFTPVSMPNRVLTTNNTTNNWQRIDTIITETGALINVDYSLPECTATNHPAAAETNTMRCYPVLVPDPNDSSHKNLITEWWQKYLVTSVAEADVQLVDGHQAPPVVTSYEYVGSPSWHYADDDGLTKPDRKTWSQFRGYGTVLTRVGDVPGQQTLTESHFLRGMHGDRLAPAGGTRIVTVPASLGDETIYDEDQFAGIVREVITYDGDVSKPVSKTVAVPWLSPPVASRTINGNTVSARFSATKITYAATALGVNASRGWRTTRIESSFSDTYGTVEWTSDSGDLAVTGDEKCTTYTYNRNITRNIIGAPKQTTTTTLPCDTAPRGSGEVISDVRKTYDGATSADTAPSFGDVTKVEQLKDWLTGTGTVWQTVAQATYDAFGRPVSGTDIKNRSTITSYSPASGGPVTKVTTTSPAPFNWVNSAESNPYWGSTTKTTDQNLRVAEASYDALGRTFRVWNVGWTRAGHETSPSVEYSYSFAPNRDAYPYVTTKTLHAAGGYLTSYQITDSLLRPRQTQSTAVSGGGRVVTDTLYDKLGRAQTTYAPHAEPGTAGGTLWWEPEWSVAAVTRTVFDNAGRATDQIFYSGNGINNLVEKWRTVTNYQGDLTMTTPPLGGTPTTVLTDAKNRTLELRQHTTASGVAGAYQTTKYTYNHKEQLIKVADPSGNEWIYTFDVRGRQTEVKDPDKGITKSAYNDFNEIESITDARGEVLWNVYDDLGRRVELRDDSATGALRAAWKYDTLSTGQVIRGQLAETWRYDPPGSANIYKQQTTAYNTRYQPTTIKFVIPSNEGTGLAGTWTFGLGYSNYDGSPTVVGFPAGGDLVAESVTTVYDAATGLPNRLNSNAFGVTNYVAGQQYTPYGEPSVTTAKTAGGLYVESATYYDEATRWVTRTTVAPETAIGSVSDRGYAYNPAGNIISITDTPQVGGPAKADKQCFAYDTLQQLTSAWTPQTSVACSTNPSIANLGGPAPYWMDWTIDSAGNRTREVSHTAAGDTTRAYALPNGGATTARPHAVTAVTTTSPGQPAVTTRYGYDNTGNTTCRPAAAAANACLPDSASQALTWDAEGRLSTVVAGGNTIETDVYQADGARLVRRDVTGTTIYLPGTELHRAPNGSVTTTRYYTFAGRTIASRLAVGLAWLYNDHQGTQQVAIAAATQTVSLRRQTPYGGSRGPAVAWPNQKGFVSGDTNATDLVHLGAREYDPSLGRFISVDPLQDLSNPQQWSGYTYAINSPISRSDPSGLMPPPGEPRAETYWRKLYNPDHNKAVEMWANVVRKEYSYRTRELDEKTGKMIHVNFVPLVTTDLSSDPNRARNKIKGASGNNPDNGGQADIICWNCEAKKILIWDVKHEGGQAENPGGAKSVNRYVDNLQELHKTDGISVQPGPDFEDELVGISPVTQTPLHVHASKTVRNQGVVVYRGAEYDKIEAKRKAKEMVDYAAVEEDPVADLAMMAAVTVGVVVVGACIVSVGCLVAGGVVVVGTLSRSDLALAA